MTDEASQGADAGGVRMLRKLLGGSDRSVKLAAGSAFSIRITNAAITYITHIIMARWMGAYEFGIFVYVWTWVLIVGVVSDLGFAITAQRVIPAYLQRKQHDLVRGFIQSSRWMPGICISALSLAAALVIWLVGDWLDAYLVAPLLLACMVLPPYGITYAQDGASRAFGWINLALVPGYIIRPLLLLAILILFVALGFEIDATYAMWAGVLSTWLTAVGQIAVFETRVRKRIEPGPSSYERRDWVVSSFPILLASLFQFMLSYVGVLLLQVYSTPEDIAVFYTATKLTAIISMVYFSVAASVAYRFAALNAAGNRQGLRAFYRNSIKWTFWPTLLVSGVIIVLGRPLLWLFGEEFMSGYSLVLVITAGLVLRAAIGPGEQVLNMMGRQRVCAAIYCVALVVNLLLCMTFITDFGAMGAAAATTASIALETLLLHFAVGRLIA